MNCGGTVPPPMQRAFTELMRDSERRLYGLALRVAPTPEDAEEVVQEALLKAYQHLPAFQGDSTLFTWVGRIVLNEGYKRQRSRGAGLELPAARNGDACGSVPDGDPEQKACEQELRSILQQVIGNLPARYRSLFIACIVEGRPAEAVAAQAALPVKVVRQRLVRARVWLREALLPCSRTCKRYCSGCIARPCRDAIVAARRASGRYETLAG